MKKISLKMEIFLQNGILVKFYLCLVSFRI